MNPDPFEQKLGRQPLRGVPPDWRAEILAAATATAAGARQAAPVQPVPMRWLRELLWPAPAAWAGLAAAWCGILLVHWVSDPVLPSPPAALAGASPMPETVRLAVLQQLQLRAELLGDRRPPDPVDRPKPQSLLHPENLESRLTHSC